jgi:hypothetical protein
MASAPESGRRAPEQRSFRRTLEWQRRSLPLMVAVLLVLAALACLSNLYQVGIVQRAHNHNDSSSRYR